jgi:membrane fusion protein (multidrug efflux system)
LALHHLSRSQLPLSLVAVFAVLSASCDRKVEAPAPPPPEVGVVKVETRTIEIPIPRVAQVESSREVDVVARVSGFLERITYEEGDLLQQGDVMFEMDKRPFIAQLDAARGELEASKARLWTAAANLERIRPLAEADAMSQSDLDQAIGEKQSAEAAVYAAQAAVTSAELDLGYTTIHAPVTGLTGQARQREGAYLNAMSESANLSYVAQLDPVWVNIAVSQNELERRRADIEAGLVQAPPDKQYVFEIVFADGSVYPHRGQVDFLSPSFDPQTGTFGVRAVVPNPDFVLRPGMFVTANVLGTRLPNAIVVPQKAVQQTAQGQIVWLVTDDGTAEARPVKTGDWVEDGWVVESGLQGGETLVVQGFQRLRPGAEVKAVPYVPDGGEKKADRPPGAGSARGASS